MFKSIHKPVLLKESIEFLDVKSGIYVDCTLGGGGHALEIVKKFQKSKGTVIGFDTDNEAIKTFESYLLKNSWDKTGSFFKKGKVKIVLINENFEKLIIKLNELKVDKVDGIVVDLGISSDQIEDSIRGFSYMKEGPLDMRMDKRLNVTAADLVNGLYKKELMNLFWEQDERHAKSIAQRIVEERKKRPIKTTLHLVKIIKKALPFKKEGRNNISNKAKNCQLSRQGRIYWIKPAMRVFQALRIAVNSELSSLRKMLPQALDTLAAGKNIVIISFHSGEDRIVKRFFKEQSGLGKVKILTKRPVSPSSKEIYKNSRARSAKLRAFKKLLKY